MTIVAICVTVIGVIVLAGLFVVYQRMRRRHAAQYDFTQAQARKNDAYHNPMYDGQSQSAGQAARDPRYDSAPAMLGGDGMYSEVPSAGRDDGGYYDVQGQAAVDQAAVDAGDSTSGYLNVGGSGADDNDGAAFDEPDMEFEAAGVAGDVQA